MKKFVLLILVILVQSCCFKRGSEVERYDIPDSDKDMIPYVENQQYFMIHSQGYRFQCAIEIENNYMSNNEDKCGDYMSYEYYYVNFHSELPSLNIDLNLIWNFEVSEPATVQMIVNQYLFNYDSTLNLTTLEINGVNYSDVYVYTTDDDEFQITEVYYSKSIGILKIIYKNGDFLQID